MKDVEEGVGSRGGEQQGEGPLALNPNRLGSGAGAMGAAGAWGAVTGEAWGVGSCQDASV